MPPTLNSSERFRDLILGAHQTYPLYSNGQLARTIIAENNLDETFYTMKKRVEIILNDFNKNTSTQASTFSLTPSDIEAATDFNLPKHNEDFGQTLGAWGMEPGPYLVMPVFGSSSVRDTVGFAVDFKADAVRNLKHVPTRNTAFTIRAVNQRANLLDIGKVAEEAALDKYRFLRDAYFQRRRNLVYDGDPPREARPTETSELEIGRAHV